MTIEQIELRISTAKKMFPEMGDLWTCCNVLILRNQILGQALKIADDALCHASTDLSYYSNNKSTAIKHCVHGHDIAQKALKA